MNNTFTWSPDELYHYGIKGQKWGLRRYQNSDGTLTPEGLRRYGKGGEASAKERAKFLNNLDQQRAYNVVRIGELKGKKNKNIEKNKAKIQEYERTIAATKRTIQNVIDNAKRSGLSVSSKLVRRHVVTGRTMAKSALLTIGATALASAYTTALSPAHVMSIRPNGKTAIVTMGKELKLALGLGFATRTTSGDKYKVKNKYSSR